MAYKRLLVLFEFWVCVHISIADSIGNSWTDAALGDSWSDSAQTAYLLNSSPATSDGNITAFHAQVKTSRSTTLHLQVWRPVSADSAVLIAQEQVSVSATESATDLNFDLTQTIQVKTGDLLGFWTAGNESVITRYQTASPSSLLSATIQEVEEGQMYNFSTSNDNFRVLLGATLETDDAEPSVTMSPPTVTASPTTLVSVLDERVYGDAELTGSNWFAVDGVTYLSLIIRFDTPMMDGYLNKIQIYSLKKGIRINFQVWREIRSAASGPAFFLVSESPHVTKTEGGFENTSAINAPVSDGDFIGLTVADGALGLPIGWIFDPIRGYGLYVKTDLSSKQALPQPGLIFTNYQELPMLNRLAIAAYVSQQILPDDEVAPVTDSTSSMSTMSSVTMTTTPISGETTAEIDLTNELEIGNKDITVGDNPSRVNFQPFFAITLILSRLSMPRDGLITAIRFYAIATEPVSILIGIFREDPANKGNECCYKAVFLQEVTVNSTGLVVLEFPEPIVVAEGDVLGFHNKNPDSLVIARVGAAQGDTPLMRLGPPTLDNYQADYSMYLDGFRYALYATMAATPPTTTTAETTTTTAVETTTTTAAETTTTMSTTTTTQVVYVTGEPGPPGARGRAGAPGLPGPTGAKGVQGPPGVTGLKGEPGLPGDDGATASAGPVGATGNTGSTGVQGATGATGEMGLPGLKGEPGDGGVTGLTGEPGAVGPAGPGGEIGQRGGSGQMGSVGQKGDQGPEGEKGQKGDQGAQGETGDRGPAGVLLPFDECSLSPCGDNSICIDDELDYSCSCSPGYQPAPSAGQCEDIDECETNNGMCQQVCVNTVGSRECSCFPGYQLMSNLRTCVDVDECRLGLDNCTGGERCFNEVGAFKCLIRLSVQSARLAQVEAIGGEDWWSMITLGLLIWCAILSVALIIIIIILIADARSTDNNSVYES